MVLSGYKTFDKILGPSGEGAAKPLVPGTWYEIRAVINNSPVDAGGQTYHVYVRGGEFTKRMKVYTNAVFRMKREGPSRIS